MENKAQAAPEYIIVLGLVLIVTIPLFYYAMRESNVNIKMNQANDAVNTLARAADTVYAIGPGTRKYVWINMPIGVEGYSLSDKSVSISLQIFGGVSDIHSGTKADLIGVVPISKGQHKVLVEMLGSGYVRLGEANDTVPPVIIWTSPQGTINYNGIVLRATTNEYSVCKFDEDDVDYDSMSEPFVGSALTHERDMGIFGQGNYVYYARCQDPYGNNMAESAIINFTIVPSGGNGTEPYEPDAPIISLISPEDGHKDNVSVIIFKYNATDKSSILLCDLIINNITAQTDYSVTKNITQNFTQGISYGNHTWNVNCTDVHGNRNSSVIWDVSTNASADLDLPVVNLVTPPNNTVRNFWLTGFGYNTSDVTSGIAYCDLHMDGVLDQGGNVDWDIRDAPVLEDQLQTITIPLFKGNYSWNVSCVDDSYSFNEGYSETWRLRINVSAGEEAFLNSCAGFCGYTDPASYSGGTCRQNQAQCTTNGEVYEQGGNSICQQYESQTGDHCCCRPIS